MISPLQIAVTLYQTSGELADAPHGVGFSPAPEGVAQIVVPQM
jgi:hypothetical protein